MSRTKGSKNKVYRNVLVVAKTDKGTMISAGRQEVVEYDPRVNINAISIIKQTDGNYIGEMQINCKLKTTRQVSPEACLQYLLYHDYEG